MAKNYGLPYQGSKSSICDELLKQLPKADHFYDLFGGGGAVSHAAVLNQKWKLVHYNEIDTRVATLLQAAVRGDYSYDIFKPEWVSREEFFLRKDSDAYVGLCWSFGNDQRTYLYGKGIESYKKSMHQAVVFGEFDDLAKQVFGFTEWCPDLNITGRRLFLRSLIPKLIEKGIPDFLIPFINQKKSNPALLQRLQQLQSLQSLERLQRLQSLEALERLEGLEGLTTTSKDYRDVEVLPNSIVYCDIPYENTRDYLTPFDREAFLNWAASAEFPVYISEYGVKDKRFIEVWQKPKRSLMAQNSSGTDHPLEKLYWNGV